MRFTEPVKMEDGRVITREPVTTLNARAILDTHRGDRGVLEVSPENFQTVMAGINYALAELQKPCDLSNIGFEIREGDEERSWTRDAAESSAEPSVTLGVQVEEIPKSLEELVNALSVLGEQVENDD